MIGKNLYPVLDANRAEIAGTAIRVCDNFLVAGEAEFTQPLLHLDFVQIMIAAQQDDREPVRRALGFALALVLFAGIRERLDFEDVPKAFKGIPIALITAGILAMAFMGFSGLV